MGKYHDFITSKNLYSKSVAELQAMYHFDKIPRAIIEVFDRVFRETGAVITHMHELAKSEVLQAEQQKVILKARSELIKKHQNVQQIYSGLRACFVKQTLFVELYDLYLPEQFALLNSGVIFKVRPLDRAVVIPSSISQTLPVQSSVHSVTLSSVQRTRDACKDESIVIISDYVEPYDRPGNSLRKATRFAPASDTSFVRRAKDRSCLDMCLGR